MEEDIRRTIARYCMLCDDGRWDEWGDLFTEDARFHVMGTTKVGRADIQEFISSSMPPEVRGRHVCANCLISVDSWNGTAKVWTDFVFVDKAGAITSNGRYHDEMVRGEDKVWRFALREIAFVGEQPTIAVPPPAVDE